MLITTWVLYVCMYLFVSQMCVCVSIYSQESFDFMAVADLDTEFLAERERELSRQRSVVFVSLGHSLTVSMKMHDKAAV